MTGEEDLLNLIISGVGGQGNILISRMLGRVLIRKGYDVTISDTFGSSQRGGAVNSNCRISKKKFPETLIPSGRAHMILSLEPLETLRMLNQYGNPNVLTLTNFHPIFPLRVLSGDVDYPDYNELKKIIMDLSGKAWFLDATAIASELKFPQSANIVMLGAFVRTETLALESQDLEEEIRSSTPREKLELNLEAFMRGFNALQI